MGRIFGEIMGVSPGALFVDRHALRSADIHRPIRAGISYDSNVGADSIVLSGGYEDDQDFGDEIVYTGHGGRDDATGKQIADQVLKRGNLALSRNCEDGLPVVRGAQANSEGAPVTGYRYDGLYQVTQFWSRKGLSGFRVWQYRLEVISDSERDHSVPPSPLGLKTATRSTVTRQRLVRNSQVTDWIKHLYKWKCQVCGVQLETAASSYAEGAHIRALGEPHNGPDDVSKVLCLCPNDHVRLDLGGIYISDKRDVILRSNGTVIATLLVRAEHRLGLDFVRYHRSLWVKEQA